MTAAPILETDRALDALLDARIALAWIRDSTLASTPLHASMLTALNATDSALLIVRGMAGRQAA